MIDKKTIWASVLYLRKFKEISKAVQLVAIAKLRKLQKVIESREYSLFLSLELFIDVNMYVFNNLRNTFVIITSDKSCCGKLNSDVLYASKDAMETYMEGNRVLKLISVGWKGRNSLAAKFKSVLCRSVSGIGKVSLFFSYVLTLCVLDTDFDKCAVYFSKYYKIFEQLASVYEFRSFNIFFDYLYNMRKEHVFFDLLLSNCILVLNNLYVYNVCLVILDSFEETKYSEFGCRAFSMETAHRNATDLINVKMLIYNKARQASITTDLLEVVAGSIYTV